MDEETIQELICCFLINPKECSNVSDLFDRTYVDLLGNTVPNQLRTHFCEFKTLMSWDIYFHFKLLIQLLFEPRLTLLNEKWTQ